MTTNWERSIRHITRSLKPTEFRQVRGRLIKAAVKKRRGLPSRSLPADLVFRRIKLRFQKECVPDDRLVRELERAVLHTRLMERKRRQRDATRRRARPSALETRIYLWRRRRLWLREAQTLEQGAQEAVTGLTQDLSGQIVSDDDLDAALGIGSTFPSPVAVQARTTR